MDVFRSALSLVIHKNGHVLASDVRDLLNHYRANKGVTIDRARFDELIQLAQRQYMKESIKLYVCTDAPCLSKSFIHPSKLAIGQLAKELQCQVETSGCHWQCEEAPVVTLKHGQDSRSFVRCGSSESWASVCESILGLNRNSLVSIARRNPDSAI
jgi:hypothetical protein